MDSMERERWLPPQVRDDAEGTAIVAALGNSHVGDPCRGSAVAGNGLIGNVGRLGGN